MTSSDTAELRAIKELSARLGRQRLLVQGSTGNTSIKLGKTLWIKASGKWLANADREEMFLSVDSENAGPFLTESAFLDTAEPAGNSGVVSKPSIETAMHLVLPHRVVIHVHSINAIAWGVQRNGPTGLRERLRGVRWRWIRYTPSGMPLAREIRVSLRDSPPDVFLLANHGLVVGAESCLGAEERLHQLEERLAIQPRPLPVPDWEQLQRLAAAFDFRVPQELAIHGLGTDLVSTRIMSGGILYPCQAMFLGRMRGLVPQSYSISDLNRDFSDQNGFRPPALIFKHTGALVAKNITYAENEMLVGFSEIVRRLGPDAKIGYLSDRRVKAVLDGGGYRYAQPSNQSRCGMAIESDNLAKRQIA